MKLLKPETLKTLLSNKMLYIQAESLNDENSPFAWGSNPKQIA